MSSAKKDLLKEIEKKAQKIRDKRHSATQNKTLEDAVYTFFRNIEDSRQIHGGTMYDPNLFVQAKLAMESRIKSFDNKAKLSVEFDVLENDYRCWEEQQVRGVTVWWSREYILRNNVDPSFYIDVSQMLFL